MSERKKNKLKSVLGIYPTIYGDGIHDDSIAIQALIDGEKVVDTEGKFVKPNDFMDPDSPKEYRLASNISIPNYIISASSFSNVSIIFWGKFTHPVKHEQNLRADCLEIAPWNLVR